MQTVTVKIPNYRVMLNNRKYLFWLFVTIISILVISIISLAISVQHKSSRNYNSHPVSAYNAGCQDLTSQWHVGETGSQGTVKVMRVK